MSLGRRQFLIGSGLIAATGGAGLLAFLRRPATPDGILLSAFEDLPGNQYIGGVVLPEGNVFGRRVATRTHGNAVNPASPGRVLFFARRPGIDAFELDLETLAVRKVFSTPSGRHLAGHGVFTADGSILLTPENDYDTPRGVIGIRDGKDFRVIGEIESHGIDPHEIAWLPDGKTLVVANGGILTHPRSFRAKLNIPTMDPSLALIDVASGRCLEQMHLPDHHLSIRHLAVAGSGDVAVGLQYEGDPEQAPTVAAILRAGKGLTLLAVPASARPSLKGYVASIAICESEGVIAAACPMGHGIASWDLATGEYIGLVKTAEAYGIADVGGTLVASQRDGTALALADGTRPIDLNLPRPLRWDDHWTRLPVSSPLLRRELIS